MSRIRITREALNEMELALERYREVLAERETTGVMKPKATETYFRYAEMFVRWTKGEFEPGGRNMA